MDIPVSKSSMPLRKPVLWLAVAAMLFIGLYFTAFTGSAIDTSVTRSELMIATVQQEDFLVDVRAPGTLQPTNLRWIAATSEGRVEQLLLQPGAKVKSDSIIMTLSNPTLSRNVESARYSLQVAEADLKALERRLQSNTLSQEAVVNDFEARYQNANFRLEANNALSDLQVVSQLDAKENELQQAQLASRLEIERKRLAQLSELHAAEIEAQQAQINQARSLLSLQESLLADLHVKAGLDGILQDIPVEQGQQVNSGAILARVAQETNLKAELRVQESLVKDVTLGQVATISVGNQRVSGEVIRIDPAVQNGVVIVDVALPDNGISGARPDLRISASIEIERQSNVLTLRRPVLAQPDTQTTLYVLNDDDTAHLTSIEIGKGSLDKVHILSGLTPGMQVIVSDTSSFNQASIISLN